MPVRASPGRRPASRVALDQRVEQRQQVGGPLCDRRALARHRGLVAARDRPGQRALGPEARPVLDGRADERHEQLALDAGASAPRRSAAASSVTRKFDAIEAAAW